MAYRVISAAVLAAALSLLAAPADAGFLDDLARAFSGAPQPRPAVEPFNPLRVTVKPRRQRVARARPYPEAETKPTPPVVKLDPSQDPYWYLKDPTIRRGDIVVTERGVLVFRGGDADGMRRSDFAALGGKPADKSWKGRLQAAAAGGRSFFNDDDNDAVSPSPSAVSAARPHDGSAVKTVQQ